MASGGADKVVRVWEASAGVQQSAVRTPRLAPVFFNRSPEWRPDLKKYLAWVSS